ncbi:helix-turn-helix domain containing protein [Phaeobacter sp. QD34_3]|uniref:TetR/AcrR family transcriptional regulator n=1 Tax=unclassified Phaeobacter TaxID=2621772 RepID=UPI00237F064F|nr:MULTISPECIES: TetR/AcrR family transcriptional regulator [unclassified Phaeobacter]MDE4134544.1 helix-turn-helix domain containing protein [Phaeobacter sp. QD34_3]MDE4138203.1 helix-turn-helix domain containing protein [Phaeobacter sp. QD34_24]
MPQAHSPQTRPDEFVAAATQLFARRGYHGASIANIADELGLTKQTLLHHFGSKDALYERVLAGVADRMMIVLMEAQEAGDTPEARLEAAFATYLDQALAQAADSRLILRELLDDRQEDSPAERWFLRPFLQELVAMVRDVPACRATPPEQALAAVCDLLGSIGFFAMAQPVLPRLPGARGVADAFRGQIGKRVRDLCSHGPRS